MNKLLITGFLGLLISVKSFGQSDYIDITSGTKEGYRGIMLNIVDKQLKDNYWIIIAKGQYKDTVVGIKIKIKNGLKPGLVNETIDNTSWAPGGVEISSLGRESDNFVKIIAGFNSMEINKSFSAKPVVFTCLSLNSEQANLDSGYFKFKIYFDDTNKGGLYTEAFLNTNFPEGYIEIPDKDPEHREDFIKAMIR